MTSIMTALYFAHLHVGVMERRWSTGRRSGS
jgi:hypothetical protein